MAADQRTRTAVLRATLVAYKGAAGRTYRRVGARSPGPCPSLSVTLVIGITSRPTFDPAPLDRLELTRDMHECALQP
jgi:hypothetical protein